MKDPLKQLKHTVDPKISRSPVFTNQEKVNIMKAIQQKDARKKPAWNWIPRLITALLLMLLVGGGSYGAYTQFFLDGSRGDDPNPNNPVVIDNNQNDSSNTNDNNENQEHKPVENNEEPPVEDPDMTDSRLVIEEKFDSKGRQLVGDESVEDPSLHQFIQQVYTMVQNKDLEGILAVMDDAVVVSFGLENSKESFLSHWQLEENPSDSNVWKAMMETLKLGGAFNPNGKSEYFAPYYFIRTPEGMDPLYDLIVITDNAPIYQEPSETSTVISNISWEILTQPEGKSPKLDSNSLIWYPVQSPNGEMGYMKDSDVRPSADYRMGMKKQDNGEWKITHFIGGD
ncbi:hypothetical protein RZN25_14390 [Bacillaceae bacterium S4-13-56]